MQKKKPLKKKRCEICRQWFTPHPRAPHQRCCSKASCQKERKARAKKGWWLNNPDYGKSRNPKIRGWSKRYPDYWRKYRQKHPVYAAKDNRRRRSSRQKAKNAAKQDSVRKIYVEKLESMRDLDTIYAAKQDPVHRRLNEILDCLIWKERSAKQDYIANCLSNAP